MFTSSDNDFKAESRLIVHVCLQWSSRSGDQFGVTVACSYQLNKCTSEVDTISSGRGKISLADFFIIFGLL